MTTQYSITTVAEKTGINPVTLRAWERRYGLIKPSRNQKGHRYFTDSDILKINHILSWLERGVSIGKVKDLLDSASEADTHTAKEQATKEQDAGWQDSIHTALHTILEFKAAQLEQLFLNHLKQYPVDTLITQFFRPLSQQLEAQTQHTVQHAAINAFYMSVFDQIISARLQHTPSKRNPFNITVFVLEGETISLELLWLLLGLIDKNWHVKFIRQPLTPKDIVIFLGKTRPDTYVVFGNQKQASRYFDTELATLLDNIKIPAYLFGYMTHIHPIESSDKVFCSNDSHDIVHHIVSLVGKES